MIGLILVTHGRLAEEFVSAMEHVVGPQEGVATICIGPSDDAEKRREEIAELRYQLRKQTAADASTASTASTEAGV